MAEALDRYAYKLLDAAEWRKALAEGVFLGSDVDLADGYIHLSTAAQRDETARKHFAGRTGLVCLTVDLEALGDAVVWEPSRGGALFPHIYGAMPTTAVVEAVPFEC